MIVPAGPQTDRADAVILHEAHEGVAWQAVSLKPVAERLRKAPRVPEPVAAPAYAAPAPVVAESAVHDDGDSHQTPARSGELSRATQNKLAAIREELASLHKLLTG